MTLTCTVTASTRARSPTSCAVPGSAPARSQDPLHRTLDLAIGDNPVLGFGYGTFADSFRLYDQNESAVHYDRAHNTWLENSFELGLGSEFGGIGDVIDTRLDFENTTSNLLPLGVTRWMITL